MITMSTMSPVLPIAAFVGFLALRVIAAYVWPGAGNKALPPGPPGIPFLGNLLEIPKSGIHLKYTQWAKTYGPIFSLKIGRGNLVILNSAYHATQLMDKRSNAYSDRPDIHVLGEMAFEGDHPMFMNADERWKLRRKLYFQMLQESKCNKDHMALIEAEACQLIRDIHLDPDNLMLHPGRYSNSIIMSLVFGIRTPHHDTAHYIKLRDFLTNLIAVGQVGATPPPELLPVFKYLPESLWRNWKTQVRMLRETCEALEKPLVDRVVERRRTIGNMGSFVDSVLDQQDKLKLNRHEIEVMCGNLLEGGTDTMATLTLTLVQAMALHPHILEAVQKEIDSVVDENEIPGFEHFARLPLVTMIIKELQRWRPPAPTAFPHRVSKRDEIDGMSIPQGTTVFVNIWGIHHDSAKYPNPEKFDPWRFDGQTELASVYANAGDHEKRDHYGYGAGRRICPGIHLAERGLYLAAAKILWGFDIKPKQNGLPIDVAPESGYVEGFLNQVLPFEVDIKVRSEKRRETLLAAAAKAEVDVFSRYD